MLQILCFMHIADSSNTFDECKILCSPPPLLHPLLKSPPKGIFYITMCWAHPVFIDLSTKFCHINLHTTFTVDFDGNKLQNKKIFNTLIVLAQLAHAGRWWYQLTNHAVDNSHNDNDTHYQLTLIMRLLLY